MRGALLDRVARPLQSGQANSSGDAAMTFRIAVVQPICHPPGSDEANVADAVQTIARAAGEGADFVCFPETYPGPWRMPARFDPTTALVEAAAKHRTHVVFGTIAAIDD